MFNRIGLFALIMSMSACAEMCAPKDMYTVYGHEIVTQHLIDSLTTKNKIPRVSYDSLARIIAGCTGRKLDHKKLQYVVGDSVRNRKGKIVITTTRYGSDGYSTIAIGGGSKNGPEFKYFYLTSASTIMHEQVHATGVKGHPDEYFKRKCPFLANTVVEH